MPNLMIKEVDKPVCTNLGDHGWCRYTVSEKAFIVGDGTKKVYTVNGQKFVSQLYHDPLTNKDLTWALLLRMSVLMPADTWVSFKNFTDNVCHQTNCDNGVGSWSQVVTDIDDHRMSK